VASPVYAARRIKEDSREIEERMIPHPRAAALFVLVIAAGSLALPSAAMATKSFPVAKEHAPRISLSLKSEGFSIAIGGVDGRVRLVAEDNQGLAVYTVDGHVSTRRMKATFGHLGRIDVRLKRSGTRVTPAGSRGACRTEVQHGVFIGAIEFRGEDEFIRVDSRRAKGTMRCRMGTGCSRRRGDEMDKALGQIPLNLPVLAAFTPRSQVVFGALGSNRRERPKLTFFVGGTVERRGAMKIQRAAFVEGTHDSFAFDADLNQARVMPPKPFRGTAEFARDGSSTAWSGDLSVMLPGTEPVPLIGEAFTAELDRPRTLGEFAELFGMQGLLGDVG
jgi:hypothetical protein